ncbi:FGGY-family carbohydrate kinase [Oricola sp.]|uniref:FGGY-family carbohydrate kinase n=1 Tax=Oricola sp. TaxID=1979950 RepID=UPI003BA9EBC5
MGEEYWLGIDAGTTAIKAAVYRNDGSQVALGQVPSEVKVATGGRSEQDMEDVWRSVCSAIKSALSGLDAADVKSVGIAAQGDGLWALDAGMQPVGPAILWNDTRASDIVDALYESGRAKAVSHACHTSIWPGTVGAIFAWLKANDPARVDQIAHVLYCADWVGYRMTGKVATDFSDATIPFLDLRRRAYDEAAFSALDVAELQGKLAAPRVASERLGTITAAAAAATGLPVGVPVSVGTMDLAAMIVGMAMRQPGETMMILGTTAVVNILADSVEKADLPVGATAFHADGQTLIRVLAPTTGAAAFDWFCALHPQTLGGASPAEIAGKLNALAGNVPPGANGITFLPYLNGERAPFVAPKAQATFFGLTSASSTADMGRAVMEGAAFSLRHCFEAEGGRPQKPVRLTGGGARNALWCQIIADVMQAPIIVSEESDHGLWGAACVGAAAAGGGDACVLAEGHESTIRYDPDPATAGAYDAAFNRYHALTEACQAIWKA